MDKSTRNHIQRATQAGRSLLERAFGEQLEGTYDILLDGAIAELPGSHLSAREKVIREKLVAAVTYKRTAGLKAKDAVETYLRGARTGFAVLHRAKTTPGLIGEQVGMAFDLINRKLTTPVTKLRKLPPVTQLVQGSKKRWTSR